MNGLKMHSEKAPLGLQYPRGFDSNHNLMQKLLNEHYRVIMEERLKKTPQILLFQCKC